MAFQLKLFGLVDPLFILRVKGKEAKKNGKNNFKVTLASMNENSSQS